jgi:hypothetical protein
MLGYRSANGVAQLLARLGDLSVHRRHDRIRGRSTDGGVAITHGCGPFYPAVSPVP